jgi:hypothetical protein
LEGLVKVAYRELSNGGLIVFNQDIEISLEYAEDELTKKAAENPKAGIFAPVFFDKKGKIFFHGANVLTRTLVPMPIAAEEKFVNQYPDDRTVECSPLYFAYITSELRRELPIPPDLGKDPFSDADYCLSAAELGFATMVVPSVHATKKHTYEAEQKTAGWQEYLHEKYGWFKKRWEKELAQRRRLPLVLQSHTGFKGGYNMHARKLAEALVKKGINLHYAFIGGSNADEPTTNNYLVDDLRNDYGRMDYPQIVLGVGELCFKNSGKYKIGFTTTEVDGIPPAWVKILNQMDEVWTTADFCVDVFKKCGVKVPIFNMGEGIDPGYFHPEIYPMEYQPEGEFRFVSCFAWGKRKGNDVLFKAYQEEFKKDEPVRLVCNCLPSYAGHDIFAEIKGMKLRDDSAPITVIDKGLEDYEVPQFYLSGDCFVLPTRGEGFGLPLLEALACGLPVITTGITGQVDYLKKNGKPRPGVHLISAKPARFDGNDSVYYYGFNWTDPNKDELKKAMRFVYENWQKEREKAEKGSAEVRRDFSWDKAADRVIRRLEILKQKGKI